VHLIPKECPGKHKEAMQNPVPAQPEVPIDRRGENGRGKRLFLLGARAAEGEHSPASSSTGRDPPCPCQGSGSGWEGQPAQETWGEAQGRGLEARF